MPSRKEELLAQAAITGNVLPTFLRIKPVIRVFGGKRYSIYQVSLFEEVAQTLARNLRTTGHLARVTHFGKPTVWFVWWNV